MEIDRAKEEFFGRWLYRTYSQLKHWTLGASPGWRFPSEAAHVVGLLAPALERINSTVVRAKDSNVWMAPSPWHAALYCQMLQHHLCYSGSRLLFRGQRNCAWPITPSILRDRSRIETESLRGKLFCKLMAGMSFNTMVAFHPHSSTNVYLRIGSQSYHAAAQHYGIKTHLIDFTPDPDVAVKFATEGDSANGEMAAIQILLVDSAEQHGLSIILPPPFIKRLYLQKGVFVRAKQTLDKSSLGIMEIQFPVKSVLGERGLAGFEVLREGGERVDIMPPALGLEKVVNTVDAIIAGTLDGSSPDAMNHLASNLKADMGDVARDPLTAWFHFVDAFEDILYALVYNFDNDDNLTLDICRFESIVHNNLEVCCSIASLYRAAPRYRPASFPQSKVAFMSQLADRIDEIAGKCGYDHKIAAERYARDIAGVTPKFD